MCAVLMISYLMSLNGGAISWRSSRQGGVTLSSSEAEFVEKPTEIWEDNASCIMMSENLTNPCKTCQMCRYSECFGRFD
jgi:hypothetical protein